MTVRNVRFKLVLPPALLFSCLLFVHSALPQTPTVDHALLTHHYQIQLNLDFDARSYTGWENVRWVNRGNHSASVLYFHLYSNLRTAEQRTNPLPSQEDDEPRIEITEVRSASGGPALNYSLEEQGTVLRVNLREPVAAGAATEVFIGFKGKVPEIDAEETGLTTHVVKQVSAALASRARNRGARAISTFAVAA